ncbi:MAG TPA: PAS domain-containing protein [Gemmatimonadetes bacterium]|nr:PAS domain-containing protein [Gemmatimonadota bacterium]
MSKLNRVGRSGWIIAVAVSFTSLITLALVPVLLERQEDVIQREIADFSSARPMFPEIALVHSREMMRIEQYVSSGDPNFIVLYQNDLRREEELLNDLRRIITGMSTVYQSELAGMELKASNWKILHSPLMDGGSLMTTRESFVESMDDDRSRYADLQEAARNFEDLLIRDATISSSRLDSQRIWKLWVTVGLVVLAISGAVAMAIVGISLQDLAQNETRRRQETVAARREMRAVLRGTGDGIIGLDMDGGCTFLNEAGSRLLGYSKQELKGKSVHHMIHHTRWDGSAYPKGECPVQLSLASGETVRILDDLLWRKDGCAFPVQLSVSPMTDGLTMLGAVLTFTDMTEIREAEKALKEAIAARDEILAVVSHDLRNPVGTIAAAAELVADVPLSQERRNEHLHTIRRAADRVNRLIQELLDVAKIEAGKIVLDLSYEDMSELVKDTVAQAGWLAEQEGVKLLFEGEEMSIKAHVDRNKILQVMSNLIENALKFTPKGGRVTVSTKREGDNFLIAVADTGMGIEPQVLDNLFDRFWQGHREDGKGSGLGLTIVKGILGAHGTTVKVRTEIGTGSSFEFILPITS